MKSKTILMRLCIAVLAAAMLLTVGCTKKTDNPGTTPAPAEETVDTDTPATAAPADVSEILSGIYEKLLSEDSDYSTTKAAYTEYYPDMEYVEELRADGFTISTKNDPMGDSTHTFNFENNIISTTVPGDDFSGLVYTIYVVDAYARYCGIDPMIAKGYVNGLGTLNINNDDFSMTEKDDGSTDIRMNVAGKWAMTELDDMVITAEAIPSEPLNENGIGGTAFAGKVGVVYNGNVDSVSILIYEYGELNDVALRSLINVVSFLQPVGYESFVSDYTALENVETDAYTVTIDPAPELLVDMLESYNDDFSYALVHFGE